jgi:hypothetical protein
MNKCIHNNTKNTCKVMKTKTRICSWKEQTNITDWVVWFRLLFHFIRCCLVIIKICGYVFILLTVWFGLLQVCCKFVASLHSQTQTNTPSMINHAQFGFIGWLINRIYNKQQYNDQSVNCCKQPNKSLTPTPLNPIISYPYPYPYP